MSHSTFNPAFLIPIALGSALGGVSRYAMTTIINDRANLAFPLGTLTVNIVGCLLIGIFVQALATRTSPMTQVLLTTGFCGGFTTFSTFSFETVELLRTGLWQRGVGYILLSVAGGLAAFWVGTTLVRAATTVTPR
jgi:fluoride exporter